MSVSISDIMKVTTSQHLKRLMLTSSVQSSRAHTVVILLTYPFLVTFPKMEMYPFLETLPKMVMFSPKNEE